nr:hypothetical protein [Planctomycetaceae bacterium]
MLEFARRLPRLLKGRRRFIGLASGLLSLVVIAWATGAMTHATLAMARQSLSTHDDVAATRWIRIAQALDPRSADAEAMLARIDRRHDRFDAADDHLRKARVFGLDRQAVRREEML